MDYQDNERIIAAHREKYGPPQAGGWLPQSMHKGSDKLPLFWIGYALVMVVVLAVIAM
jgi:hypothetical protein